MKVRWTVLLWCCGLLVLGSAAETNRSPFAIRGTLPWHNFLCGPSAWDEEDYIRYLDTLKALDLNYVAFHCYTGGAERYATYVEPLIRTDYRNVLPVAEFDTSLTARWGYRPLAISQFVFGTDKLFPRPEGVDAFGARCAVLAHGQEDRYRRAQDLFRVVIKEAHARGIQVGLGFEFGMHPPEYASIVPETAFIRGTMLPDPTHPSSIEILHLTLDGILRAYPDLDWIWLWLHEFPLSAAGRPVIRDRFRQIVERNIKSFSDCANDAEMFTGLWSMAYIQMAHDYLRTKAPKVRLAISSWGQGPVPSIYRSLHRVLPKDIVFTCLSPNQGNQPQPPVLAEIAAERETWAIPWLEGDIQLWHLQPRVSLLRDQIRLAETERLKGVLAIHWRTEEIRPNLAAFAQFAAQPSKAPSIEEFYQADSRRQYGSEAGEKVAAILARWDRSQSLQGFSPEYLAYDPGWGRLNNTLRQLIVDDLETVKKLIAEAKDPPQQKNLDWLAANLEFTLLLDMVSAQIEPAYLLKERWLRQEEEAGALKKDVAEARKALEATPLERIFQVYSRRIRSRGELGVLSSLNQRLWQCYREMDGFLKELQ